jgi:uncharacterized membrane protein YdjX (TVP38/TMEM64 family)
VSRRAALPLKPLLKGLVMLGVLGGAVWAVRSLGVTDMLRDAAWFNEHVLGSGPLSIIIYMLVGMGATALGLPRQVVCFLGGMAFGALSGTVLGTLASGLGCLACAAFARFSGREFVVRTFGPRLERLDRVLRFSPFQMAVAIRLLPVGSNLLTNLAAGVSSIPMWPFVLGSTLGYLPQSLVFALFGGGMNADSPRGVALSVGVSVALFLASAWMGVSVWRKYRRMRREEAGADLLDDAAGDDF